MATDKASSGEAFDNLWDRPGYLIRRAHHRHLTLFTEECARYDVSPVQYGMLTVLKDVPRLDAKTLIKAAGVDEAAGTAALRRLQARGYIARDDSQLDRRARPVKLTESGSRLIAEASEGMKRAQERLVEALSPDDRVRLIGLLRRIVGAGIAADRPAPRSPFGETDED